MFVSLDGKEKEQLTLPFEGTVEIATADQTADGVLFNSQGWVQAPHMFAYDAHSKTVTDTGLVPPSPVDASGYESKEVFATSYDGTLVPLSLVYKKGLVLDGSHPTILDGYGSYGNSADPGFSSVGIAWMERGGILAVAHIRGGGELGEAWHLGGQKLTKLNTVFDFIACGQYLVDQHYTTSKLLAGIGGSAGGITIGGAMTWRPDLFGVILDLVGMSDALRSENGAQWAAECFRVWLGQDRGWLSWSVRHERLLAHSPGCRLSRRAVPDRCQRSPGLALADAKDDRQDAGRRPRAANQCCSASTTMPDTASARAVRSVKIMYADLWAFSLWQMGDPAYQPH